MPDGVFQPLIQNPPGVINIGDNHAKLGSDRGKGVGVKEVSYQLVCIWLVREQYPLAEEIPFTTFANVQAK